MYPQSFFGQSILEEAVTALVEKRSEGAVERAEALNKKVQELKPLAAIAKAFIATVKVGDIFETDTGIMIRVTEVLDRGVHHDWWHAKKGAWYEHYPVETMEKLVTYKRALDPSAQIKETK